MRADMSKLTRATAQANGDLRSLTRAPRRHKNSGHLGLHQARNQAKGHATGGLPRNEPAAATQAVSKTVAAWPRDFSNMQTHRKRTQHCVYMLKYRI